MQPQEQQTDQDIYGGYIPPDIPQGISRTFGDQIDFIKELLNKNEIKSEIAAPLKLYFEGLVKNLAISNFSESDVRHIMNSFDDMKTALLMQYPPGAYSWEMEYQFSALRPLVFTEACRGKDGFERRLMATSINQTYLQQDMRGNFPGQQQSGTGFMGRIRKMFSRGY